MITTTLLALTGLLSFASAQTTHNVTVGANGALRFDPQSINATKGDTVQFTFSPKNHTVTQSAFNPPCIPLAGGGGFNSGFKPVAAGATGVTTVSYTLTDDTDPLWFYCEQVGHCGQGMVFAINAPTTGNTFEAFQAAAIKQNGTSTGTTSSTATAPASTGSYSVAPPDIVTVTDTVTLPSSTYVTTYASWPGSAAPTPAANPQNHVVQVGANDELVYSPSNITAGIGDTVTFVFSPKNHTVTQSSFLKPCEEVENGFNSGFNFATTSGTASKNYTITVNGTAPIWVYCAQPGHCGKGMVFAVNAVADSPNNFTAFQHLALSINGTASASSTGSSTSSTTTGKSAAVALSVNGPAFGMVGATLALAVVSGFLL